MKKRLLLSCLAAAWAGAAPAADLIEIYREAAAQDAQYAAARASLDAAREKLPQGMAGLLPSVNLSANTTDNDIENSITGSRNFNSRGYGVTASQPLFRWENFAAYEQAKHSVAQAEAGFGNASQDLILRVAQAYFDILLAEVNLRAANAFRTSVAEQLEFAKRSFEVGTATIVDTHEAQARHDLATAQEIAAESEAEVKKRALQAIIGREPGELKKFPEYVPLESPDPNNMAHWVELAEKASFAVRGQESAVAVATEEVSRNRGGHLPTLDLVATYNDVSPVSTTVGVPGGNQRSTTVGLQLALPIFQGGGQQSRVREAVALEDKARQDLLNARRSAALAARQAFLNLNSGIAQARALEQALRSSQSQLDSTKLGREVGVRTAVDVLNADQQLFFARRDLAQAYYNYLMSRLRLKAAVGTLAEDDLARINQALQ